MGEVYRALDTIESRAVVLKVFSDRLSGVERRLQAEAEAAQTLSNHPNILAVYEVGHWRDRVFVAMEYIDGVFLAEKMGAEALGVSVSLRYAEQVAQVLATAHTKGIVHGHLTPSELLITPDNQVKVFGFGSPERFGRPGYMAPEQIRGEEWDHRADVFSLGAILYEMLSGAPAFRGDSFVEIVTATLSAIPPSLRRANSKVSARLERVVLRCLAKDPRKRIQSARDLASELYQTGS